MTYVVFTLFRCLRFPTKKIHFRGACISKLISILHIQVICKLIQMLNKTYIYYSFRHKKILTIHICHSCLLGHPWFLLIVIDLVLIYTLLRYGCLLYCLLPKVCAFCLNIINGFSNYARPRNSLKKGTFFEWIMLHNRK